MAGKLTPEATNVSVTGWKRIFWCNEGREQSSSDSGGFPNQYQPQIRTPPTPSISINPNYLCTGCNKYKCSVSSVLTPCAKPQTTHTATSMSNMATIYMR